MLKLELTLGKDGVIIGIISLYESSLKRLLPMSNVTRFESLRIGQIASGFWGPHWYSV